MLILTRRIGESLIIGNNVKLTVCGISSNQVRISIEAPRNVSVHRKEIYDKILAGKDGNLPAIDAADDIVDAVKIIPTVKRKRKLIISTIENNDVNDDVDNQ